MALCICFQRVSIRYIAGWRGSSENPAFFYRCTKDANVDPAEVSKNGGILSANSNHWYFNNLVKKPCHKTHCRCPHRLNLSFQPSRSCALPNIKVLKDKDLEFANSIRPLNRQTGDPCRRASLSVEQPMPKIFVRLTPLP